MKPVYLLLPVTFFSFIGLTVSSYIPKSASHESLMHNAFFSNHVDKFRKNTSQQHSHLFDTADIQTVGFSTQWISQPDAMSMLDQMDDKELAGYLKNMIPKEELFKLIDKRIFAKRALTILYQQNVKKINTALAHKTNNIITMGLSPTYTHEHADTSRVDIDQKLYAHLKVPNKTVHGGKVFVTWIHRESGDVKLFNMMYLNPAKNENWVSLKPTSGWQKGSYDVNFYRFSNALEPIAKHTFHIDHVINDGLDEDEWNLDELMPEEDPKPDLNEDNEEDTLHI